MGLWPRLEPRTTTRTPRPPPFHQPLDRTGRWRSAFHRSYSTFTGLPDFLVQHIKKTGAQNIPNGCKIISIVGIAPVAWHSGHRVRLQNRRSRVRIPPGSKLQCCCQKNALSLCLLEKNKRLKHLKRFVVCTDIFRSKALYVHTIYRNLDFWYEKNTIWYIYIRKKTNSCIFRMALGWKVLVYFIAIWYVLW
jgi:hypothetical protein